MIIATIDKLDGKRTTRIIGLVRGSSVRARHVGRDILAQFRNLVGGEVEEYTKLLAQSREVAVSRMVEQAETQGANAILGTRFITAAVMSGAAEMLAYGTAVVLEDESS